MPVSGMPRIGLVADNDLSRHLLQSVLSEAGYDIVVAADSKVLLDQIQSDSSILLQKGLDAWLVDIDDDKAQVLLDSLSEKSDLPLLISDDIPERSDHYRFNVWRRRLLDKMEVLAVRHGVLSSAPVPAPAQKVWVLVGSLGGPEALNVFLRALPASLPAAIVYGQHIEKHHESNLVKGLSAVSALPLELVRGEYTLQNGHVAVVPADKQLRFLSAGRVVETQKSWEGIYRPALDQIIADLARVYRQNLGVIIFSGTCDDGAIGCRVAKACGATLWAQQPDSCISDAMPLAAIKTGCVSLQGTPEQLAESLIASCSNHLDDENGIRLEEKRYYKVG